MFTAVSKLFIWINLSLFLFVSNQIAFKNLYKLFLIFDIGYFALPHAGALSVHVQHSPLLS